AAARTLATPFSLSGDHQYLTVGYASRPGRLKPMRVPFQLPVSYRREPRRELDAAASAQHRAASGPDEIRFVPARWLVVALSVSKLVFSGRRIGGLGIAALVWSVTPRKLKLVAAVFALSAVIVVMGALAAITLLAIQLA